MNARSCHICPHPDGDHVLISTGAEVYDGGIRLCPVLGCKCFSTWSRYDRSADSVRIPSDKDIAELRAKLQQAALIEKGEGS